MPITVSIVDDDDPLRESLEILISGSKGFRCLGAHRSAELALQKIPCEKPDVVLMDINLPRMSGIECVSKLKALVPNTQVLMVTVYEDSDQIFKSLVAGASGYLVKDTPPAEILEAIQDVHRGGSPMSSHIARKVVKYFQTLPPTNSEIENLSAREQEIMSYLAKGYRYKEIAETLSISVLTVRSHLRRVYEKLHVRSRTEAVVKFLGR